MAQPGRGNARVIVAVLLVVLVAAGGVVFFATRPADSRNDARATTLPTSLPSTTQAATRPAPAPKPGHPTSQYVDVVRAHHPRMPQTQPLGVPLDLSQAARLVFPEPVYLSPRSDLWITRADAPPTAEVLARAAREQGDQLTLATREYVRFAHWTPQQTGPWTFTLIVRGDDGGDEIVTPSRRTPITTGRTYHWHRAMEWGERVVVPTDTGVSVLSFEPEFRELHRDLIDPGSRPGVAFAEPRFLMDWEGILAWVPWEQKKSGSVGAARFVDDRWLPLGPQQGWPEKLLHLVPLVDGGVLQLVPTDDEFVRLAFTSLERVAVDEALVAQHVEKLSDPEEQVRADAFKELTRYGASAWPVLERMMGDQGPEAQARLKQLLKSRDEPTLGGFSLLGDKLRVVARLEDGGAVFYAEVGVATAGEGEDPIIRSPAWVSVRPGQAVSLLDGPFTADLDPERSKVYAFGDEWVVTNSALGPQRFVGNGFVPLLRKRELAFSEPAGIDRRGRWLFRKPRQPHARAASTQASTAPSTTTAATRASTLPSTDTISAEGDVLVIDPTLPDPTPRLPVWVYSTAETVGWDKENWPAVKRVGAWALREDGWRPMKRTETLLTTPADIPPVAGASATAPATTTASATGPTTATTGPSAENLGPPVLVDVDGTRYYDGHSKLLIVRRDGRRLEWALPPGATGTLTKVHLARTGDGLLFLYNQPGRLLRIRPTPDEPEPFLLEATFTRNVPNADDVTRMWVDPSERLIMAYGSKLAIMFPRGYIPPAIASKIPPAQMETEE
jgi:hypothetical protein